MYTLLDIVILGNDCNLVFFFLQSLEFGADRLLLKYISKNMQYILKIVLALK